MRDTELANWVRNQRLEYANQQRNKKTRMTQERLNLLNSLGFTWSNPMPSRAQKVARVEERVEAATAEAEKAATSKHRSDDDEDDSPAAPDMEHTV